MDDRDIARARAIEYAIRRHSRFAAFAKFIYPPVHTYKLAIVDSATPAGAPNAKTIGQGVILAGTLGARPAANSLPAGTTYLATDDAKGTIYRSDGGSWVNAAQSVGGKTVYGPWKIANIAANMAEAKMTFAADGVTTRAVFPNACWISRLYYTCSQNVTSSGAGAQGHVAVLKNGAALPGSLNGITFAVLAGREIIIQSTGGPPSSPPALIIQPQPGVAYFASYAWTDAASMEFVSGDYIEPTIKTDAGFLPAGAVTINLWIETTDR